MIIGLTQNISKNQYNKEINCLESSWIELFKNTDNCLLPILNVNYIKINQLFKQIKFDLIILSGGNNIFLNKRTKNAYKKRDQCEKKIIELCIKNNIPILGICRGMQILNIYFGGKLSKIMNHSKTKHHMYYSSKEFNFLPKQVNSNHNFAIQKKNLGRELISKAEDKDQNVELFIHETKKIIGVMWHPERMKGGYKQILGFINFLNKK